MYRELTTFDADWKKANMSREENWATLLVPANSTERLIGPLKISTMYEVKMLALNKYGESMATNEIRVVTHAAMVEEPPTTSSPIDVIEDGNRTNSAPSLRRCCSNHGVKNDACLKQLCEPFIIEPVDVEESIMCMKYMNTSYKCIEEIRDNIDYELVDFLPLPRCGCSSAATTLISNSSEIN